MDEVQDAIDTSIGEIPKPKPVSMGAYSTVGTSGVAATDGFITSKSYDNTSITAYVNGLQIMHTAGRNTAKVLVLFLSRSLKGRHGALAALIM